MKKLPKTTIALILLGVIVILAITLGEDPTLEMSYSQVTKPFLTDMTFNQVKDENGLPRYKGTTPNGKAALYIIGDKENISKATLILDFPSGLSDQLILRQHRLFNAHHN